MPQDIWGLTEFNDLQSRTREWTEKIFGPINDTKPSDAPDSPPSPFKGPRIPPKDSSDQPTKERGLDPELQLQNGPGRADLDPVKPHAETVDGNPDARGLSGPELGPVAQDVTHVPNKFNIDAACVFSYRCCPWFPVDPVSSEQKRQLDVVARLLVLFFFIDDSKEVENENNVQIDMLYRKWLEEFDSFKPSPIAKSKFKADFESYLRSRRTEIQINRHEISVFDHWRIRQDTIFIKPYLGVWFTSMNAGQPSVEQPSGCKATKFFLCCHQLTNIIALANDLGSLKRDNEGKSGDLNLVHTYSRELYRRDENEAVRRLVDKYNAMIQEFQASLVSALDESGAHLENLLRGVINGNRSAMLESWKRYGKDISDLKKLHKLPRTILS